MISPKSSSSTDTAHIKLPLILVILLGILTLTVFKIFTIKSVDALPSDNEIGQCLERCDQQGGSTDCLTTCREKAVQRLLAPSPSTQ